jgi:hypothetical protein
VEGSGTTSRKGSVLSIMPSALAVAPEWVSCTHSRGSTPHAVASVTWRTHSQALDYPLPSHCGLAQQSFGHLDLSGSALRRRPIVFRYYIDIRVFLPIGWDEVDLRVFVRTQKFVSRDAGLCPQRLKIKNETFKISIEHQSHLPN